MPETLQIPVDEEDFGAEAAFEYTVTNGCGDGLPVIPPTAPRVERMIAASGRRPNDIIAPLLPKGGSATIERVAVNAVMAGCRPEDFPVVVAAIEALAEPKFELLGINTTTNPAAPLLIVNGPVRQQLGIHCADGVLGPYFRANATIGRAISLCMINIAGRIPGLVSKGTYKVPGAFTMCAGEWEEESPWEPLHVQRGLSPQDSAVTVVAVTGTNSVVDIHSKTPDDLAKYIASSMSTFGTTHIYFFGLGEVALMINPVHARILAQGFKKKEQLQEYFQENCRIPEHFYPRSSLDWMETSGTGHRHIKDSRGYWLTERADQYLLFVAGGLGGIQECFFTTFGDSYAVTKKIESRPTRPD